MALVKLTRFRTSPAQYAVVDTDATVGARIGTNLLMPDGSLATPTKLAALFGAGTAASDGSITTTDDVEEGQWNLWFTKKRAQDAVGGILTDTGTISFDYVAGTTIAATLKDLADSGTGALLAITRDAKGRVSGTRDATITGTAGRVTVANGNASAGLPAIDLATVADAGGGALLRFVRDAWGRIAGTSAATTTDLTEGGNLYFTNARADARITAQKGVADGLAPLGGDAKINVSYLPAAVLGQVSYQGTWDASAGTPPTTTPEKGWYYIVTVAGTTDLDGTTEWDVGDWAIYNGASWDKIDNTDAVVTVNGYTGAVTLTAADVGAATAAQGALADSAVQPGDLGTAAALNAPASGDASATEVVLGSDSRLGGGSGASMPPGYIDGLKMLWVSGAGLTVSSGAAYIEGSSAVLNVPSAIAKTGLSLTASTWYHVYLYDNAGTPDFELSTTAPEASYNGTARSKTGDASRRYVGSVKTDASGNIYPISHVDDKIYYTSGNASGIFSALSAGTATTSTSISLAAVVPITAAAAILRLANNSTTSNFALQMAVGADRYVSIAQVATPPGPPVTVESPIAGQAMAYICGGAGGGANIGLLGYTYER